MMMKDAARKDTQHKIAPSFNPHTTYTHTLCCSQAFFVQFPDPHFKKRHRKRRLLQPDTVAALRDVLRPGGAQDDACLVCLSRTSLDVSSQSTMLTHLFLTIAQPTGQAACFCSRT